MYFYIFLYKSFLLKTLFKQADVISESTEKPLKFQT